MWKASPLEQSKRGPRDMGSHCAAARQLEVGAARRSQASTSGGCTAESGLNPRATEGGEEGPNAKRRGTYSTLGLPACGTLAFMAVASWTMSRSKGAPAREGSFTYAL